MANPDKYFSRAKSIEVPYKTIGHREGAGPRYEDNETEAAVLEWRQKFYPNYHDFHILEKGLPPGASQEIRHIVEELIDDQPVDANRLRGLVMASLVSLMEADSEKIRLRSTEFIAKILGMNRGPKELAAKPGPVDKKEFLEMARQKLGRKWNAKENRSKGSGPEKSVQPERK